MSSSPPGLAAIATYVPERVVDNADLVARFGFEPAFLDDKLGISRRHICAPDETVSDMAVAAGRRLIETTGIDPATIGLLVLVTQNPDYKLPTTANIVQHRLGLPQSIAAFDVNQGCSGYVYGLSIAKALMAAHAHHAALLITSEAYSKVMDPADRTTAPLFGDGATASLILPGGQGQIGAFTFGSDGSGAEELIVRAGGSRNPAMACAGAGALAMNGRSIFNFMMRRVPADVRACLAANATQIEGVDLFLFHQASRYMVEALAKGLGLPADKVPIRMTETGNTVSSTIPMLIDALGGVAALAGKRALLSGFGVGLSWASTIITFGASKA
jgi:3-oxoacyl-[acyl-carrier-protein] synthase-3